MNDFAKRILFFRKGIIISTLIITILAGYFLKDLKINPDVFDYLPEDDPISSLFKQVGKDYGGNYIGLIGLEMENVFSEKSLLTIKNVTDTLKTIKGVGYVTSLTNVIDIKGSDWGIEIGKLVDDYNLPKSRQEVDSLTAYTLSQEMYRGVLVSEDCSFTAIMVKITEGEDKIEIARNIKSAVESIYPDDKLYFGGIPFHLLSVSEIILNDIIFLIPFTALIIMVVLYFGFRSVRGVLLPLLTVLISTVWTIGLMGAFGIELSIISDVIPVILLAVGSAYTIHVYNRINCERGSDHKLNTSKALGYIVVPVFLAALTTMIGFISFIFGSYLTMISNFGIFMAIGVAFALILSVTFAPSFIAVFPGKKLREQPVTKNEGNLLIDKILKKLNRVVSNKPVYVISFWIVLIMIGILGATLIERRVDLIDYFQKSDPMHESELIFREKFGGSFPVYVKVEGDILSPEVLNEMRNLEDFMKQSPNITHTQSLANLIEEMNEVMGEGKTIPAERDKIEQLWFLLQGQEVLEQLVTYELDQAIVTATFNTGDVNAMQSFIDDLDRYIKESMPGKPVKITFTGLPSLYLKIDKSIVNSQFQSLLFAFILTFIVVSVIYKSAVKGALTMLPILATLVILFGFMGLAGIPLDVATVLVGSVSIGIGIDYGIHMMNEVDHRNRNGFTLVESASGAILTTGRPIIINFIAIAMGFLVLVFSDLVPLQRFGLLIAITMVTSGTAALTLFPSILILIQKRKRSKQSSAPLPTRLYQKCFNHREPRGGTENTKCLVIDNQFSASFVNTPLPLWLIKNLTFDTASREIHAINVLKSTIMKTIHFIFILFAFCIIGFHSSGQTADELLRKNDDATYAPKDQKHIIKMILTDSKGREQTREANALQKGRYDRLFRFTAPASQAGIAFLSLPDDVMYIYLPAYEKERRIASHVKNQSFAGTDLSYEDMESIPLAEKYTAKLLEKTDRGFRLELIPKPDFVSEYSKNIILIDKSNFMTLESEFYDKGGILIKKLVNHKIEKFKDYWIITDLEVTDLRKNHKTRMLFTNVEVDTGLSEDEFTVRKLIQ